MLAGHSSNEVTPDEFLLNVRLPHFRFLLTEEEIKFLSPWAKRAQELQHGNITPESDKEHLFVEICKGLRPPETKFHRLWLRYSQAVAAEQAFLLVGSVNTELDFLRSEVSRLKSAHSGAWKHHAEVKAQFEQKLHFAELREKELRKIVFEYKIKLGVPDEAPAPPDESEPWAMTGANRNEN